MARAPQSLKDSLKAMLPAKDQMEIARAMTDKLSGQVDAYCEAVAEAHLPVDTPSQDTVLALLARLGARPAAGTP